MKPAGLGLAASILLGLSSIASANDLLATEAFSGTTIALQPQQNYSNLTLRVAGPQAFTASISVPNGAPALDLSRFGTVYDGNYSYHLTGTTGEVILSSGNNDGRSAKTASPYKLRSVSKSGNFTVRGGTIVAGSAAPRKIDR
jgi:hypothetical protein